MRSIDALLPAGPSDLPRITADLVVEATGTAEGSATGRRVLRPQGTAMMKSICHSFLTADSSGIVVDEVQIAGFRCGRFAPALRLLAMGLVNVESMIFAHYPLEQGVLALERAAARGTLKVLIEV